ncbi:MAG: alpha/beta hydrolase [Anaerolineales bacterium]
MNTSKLQKRIISALTILIIVLVSAYFISDDEKSTLNPETRSTLPGEFVALSNGMVHYELDGPEDAPVVVLVHGFSVPYYVWDPTFEALTEAGFRTLRFDLYGRGYSDRPDIEYSLDLFTAQLQGLLSALEITEPVSLVGLSFGGPVVAKYANEHPGQVRDLILIDPQVAPVSTGEIFPLSLPGVGEYIMAVYMAPVMLPRSQPQDFYRPERFPDWEAKYRVQMHYKGFRRAILSTIRNMVEMDAMAEYEALDGQGLPVLLLWGREDETIGAADIELLRAAIPEAEFHPVEEAGHLPHYEQAGAVNPLLIEFLSRP